ncbi:MAG: RagB/SusD family nutrient uptake outer membrane protein [Bacteroides sp.]|uniref:RagB/SusD family nutrient uptake outer membrane protein n=1 Tax=Bacteroides sp. TaxID=29523 RepID=UPI0026E03E89|nr:RagB/SusD family nutrient uptake outer membrane protein [Bacteroides sp.]MDO5420876.1 RagB/SusD family nutrient uptake outer membrane protein [Bacteroides sp.]
MMRKYIMWFVGIAFFSLVSCDDYLNKLPDEDLTVDDIFDSRDYTRNFLAHIYSWLPTEANFADPGGAWRNPFVGGCDEMEIAYGGSYTHQINSGAWNPNNITDIPIWNESYMALRKVNMFLEKLDKVPTTVAEKEQWRGEAYFLRAYFHFLSFRAYGPIVLLDRSLELDDDLLSIGRRSIEECVAFMSADCDRAAKILPDKMPSTDTGRATRIAALALKSRILLYAASPLYNGNIAYTDFTDSLGMAFFPVQYDGNKWKTAADAALSCIQNAEKAGYGLYHSANDDPVMNYQEIFYTGWNREVIFAKNMDRYNHYLRCADPIGLGGYSIINPTQDLVDAYEMENGQMPISGYTEDGMPVFNEASGYREDGYAETEHAGRWEKGVHNMFTHREPRFYASINYPGQIWKGHRLELWFSGVDGKRYAGSDYCKTGYLMRKIVDPSFRVIENINPLTTWIYFRLAEQYLNYAEALNEFSGPSEDVYKYVNLVRSRSGLPSLPLGLNKEEMRNRIKHERRIELAFETHRFFDVRRWKDAEKSENKPIHALNIMEGEHMQDDRFYKRIFLEDRTFEPSKHYFFPIAQNEIDKNVKNLMQNPGW